ncbi:putative SOS response-associated peptidase YedK [compost metagenome]
MLTPEVAKEWLDPTTTPERAAEIVEAGCRPAQDFRWFPVGKAVGNVRNQGPELIEPVSEESRQGDLEL